MEFDRQPNPELQTALEIKMLAETFNETPEYVNETIRRNITLNGGYKIELRVSHNTSPEPEFDLPDSRIIYFLHDQAKGPLFSFDINKDTLADYSRKWLDMSLLEELVGTNTEADNDTLALLGSSISALRILGAEQQPTEELRTELSNDFQKLISEGSCLSITGSSVEISEGSKLSVEQAVLSGSLEHVWKAELAWPRLKVTLTMGDKRHVLEQNHAGNLESYVGSANAFSDKAAGLDPAMVDRNEEGEIVVIRVDLAAEEVVASAQRAMGLRQLTMEVLEPIYAALKAVTFSG